MPAVPPQGLRCHDDAHPRSLPTEECPRVGIDSNSHDVDERVGETLVVGAIVGRRLRHHLDLLTKRDTTTRRHDRVERAEEMLTRLRVEQERTLIHAIVAHPPLEVASVSSLPLPSSDAGLIKAVASRAGFPAQFIEG